MHACPLRSLELKNFKSIVSSRVEFNPLTVLVGMNSSGKSSLLQAVRFLSQTATAHKIDIEVPLNGTKVTLGTFDDVRTVGTDGPVSLRVELVPARHEDPDGDEVKPLGTLLTLEVAEPDTRPDRGHAKVAVNQIEVPRAEVLSTIRYCAESWLRAIWDLVEDTWYDLWDRHGIDEDWDDEARGDRLLDELQRQCGPDPAYNLEDRSLIRAGVIDIRGALAGSNAQTSGDFLRDMWESVSKIDDEASRSAVVQLIVGIVYPSPSDESAPKLSDQVSRETLASLIGDELSTLIFEFLVQSADYSFRQAIARAFYQMQDAEVDTTLASNDDSRTPDSASLEQKIKVLRDRRLRYSSAEVAAMGLSMIEVGGLSFVEDSKMNDEGPETWPRTDTLKIARLFVQENLEGEWTKGSLLGRRGNDAIAGRFRPAVTELLLDCVRYLGPLRQEPRAFFDFDDEDRPDVGAAGEHLARVLQWHGTKSVDVPGLGQAELVDGLQHWLRELGVVEDITVEARGRAGVSIEVRPPDLDHGVDLTSVGVGVSQVLPVLAVCLLAEPGDIVMLEQPELHLHPALQMRLADFLVACVESGRQIIVETHSEHLVNRLRRRVAEDKVDSVRELVRVVFAERDAAGHTSFRPSDINPLGGLSEDWPDGFLDVGARDAQKLLQASLAKHRRQSDN